MATRFEIPRRVAPPLAVRAIARPFDAVRAIIGAVLLMSSPAAAESLGAYVHGEVRSGDEGLVACADGDQAVGLAKGINDRMTELAPELEAAADSDARQAIVEAKLYPSRAWRAFEEALLLGDCDLMKSADHVSRATVMTGPEPLARFGARHSVVRTEILLESGDEGVTSYVITTEDVPE